MLLALLLSVRSARAREVDDDNFRSDVFRCEEAIGRLLECCPGFVAGVVHCTYLSEESTSGCDFSTTVTTEPAFGVDESLCILGSTCETLRDSGVCARAQVAAPYVSVSRSSIDSPEGWREPSSHEPVCP
ncbi:MAG: hypothetical protein KIT84_41650 [Labilithrix sp.]|nr:hypothetical protein [Labilithrix sp.]MCW5817578.1 hypothetical protein [Labilithrix sp.]